MRNKQSEIKCLCVCDWWSSRGRFLFLVPCTTKNNDTCTLAQKKSAALAAEGPWIKSKAAYLRCASPGPGSSMHAPQCSESLSSWWFGSWLLTTASYIIVPLGTFMPVFSPTCLENLSNNNQTESTWSAFLQWRGEIQKNHCKQMRIGAEKLSQLRLYKWCWMPKTNKQHRARLSSRQLCKTAAAPRKVGILPWCFVAMKINRCKGSMPCMPKHPKPWGCRDLGPDFLVAVSLLSPNRTDSAVLQFLQTALALNKSSPVPCLAIWRFPDLGPGWVPRENGSIRSPSKESSESTSLGVE